MNKIIMALGFSFAVAFAHAGERPTVDKFFEGQRINEVSISPDGRYLGLVVTGGGLHYAAVMDRQQKVAPKRVIQLDPAEHASFRWCKWAKSDRFVCSIMITTNKESKYETARRGNHNYFASTRLIAVDANGENFKVVSAPKADWLEQFQDKIIDWLPDDPDHALFEFYGNFGKAVYKLNVRNGIVEEYEKSQEYVAGFASDGKGNVRLAGGIYFTTLKNEPTLKMFARAVGSKEWKEIITRTIDIKNESNFLDPETIIPDTNEAYATGDYKGFKALWIVSLTGKSEPQMVYSQPDADVYTLLGPDQQLLGVGYDGVRSGVKYFNAQAQQIQEVADRLMPGLKNRIVSITRDLKTAIVHSESDQAPDNFVVLDLSATPVKLERVGSAFPGLKGFDLATVEQVNFKAGDGVSVPGFLTKPSGVTDLSKVPLIVLPHGGPYARDQWGFDSWTQFLASRGYAVLQIEFRGSTGFGSNWFRSGFADWAGKPYSDVIDGAKWALASGYGDASRTCIVGGSFGGYMALLAAARNQESKLFKCAVSIAGVSDLRELIKDERRFVGWRMQQQSIGDDSDKLRDSSPIVHVKEVNIPIMLIHGDQDYTVEVDESRMMDSALARANKPHEFVIVKGADHHFRDDAYLKQMFVAMDGFLAKHLAEK